jgi:carboxyl-terminal processing protease
VRRTLLLFALVLAAVGPAGASAQPAAAPVRPASDWRADALSLEALIAETYAYPERLDGGQYRLTPPLRAEAARVADGRALVRFAERALLLLADHHAITGSSLAGSWAVVPTYADLWIVRRGANHVVEAVRPGSPAAQAGVRPGDVLAAVDGMATAEAVAAFWEDLGVTPVAAVTDERAGFAARILAAGRRDARRRLSFERAGTALAPLDLPNLYQLPRPDLPPVTAVAERRSLRLRFNDSLGDSATIAAFDAAMAQARPGQRIVLDLTETPSGGNSNVARAILGWFVDRPSFYQMHSLPSEARQTGIARQWVEQVLPRPGRRHRGPVTVLVGRWTGSMGEGLAIGFDAIGAEIVGTRMAGLLGAVYDRRLERSGLVVKLPAERLMSPSGLPREDFVPRRRAPRRAASPAG